MPVTINKSAVSHANSLIRKGAVNTSSRWGISAGDENQLLGDGDWASYGKWFLGIDTSEAEDTKARYKYPFGKAGKLYRSALIACRSRAGQQDATAVFEAAGRLLEAIDARNKKTAETAAKVSIPTATPPVYLTFDAHFVADTQAASASDAPRKFTGVAYSGGLIPRYGALGDSVINLSDIEYPQQIFALLNHNPDQLVGTCQLSVVETPTDQGPHSALHAHGELFKSTDCGKLVASTSTQNAPWQLSVGIQGSAAHSPEPVDRLINGRWVTANTVFHSARVLEVSFVPAGADPDAMAAVFERRDAVALIEKEKETEMSMNADELQQLNELSSELSQARQTIAEQADRLKALTDEKSAAEKQSSALEAQLSALREAVRTREVKSLFEELGRECTAESIGAYLTMTDAQFSAVAADMRAFRPTAPEYLFARQGAADVKSSATVADLTAKLRAQVAGKPTP